LVHTQVMITYSIPTEKTDKEKEEQQQEKEEEVVVVGHETGPEYTHSQSVSQDMRRDTSIYRQSVHANERSLPRRVVGRGAAPHCPPCSECTHLSTDIQHHAQDSHRYSKSPTPVASDASIDPSCQLSLSLSLPL
jgi:hypothetical protein